MNILIVNTLYYPYKVGGAERSVQLLAEMLAIKGNEVTVATLHEQNYISTEKINNVKIVRFPLLNSYWPYSGDNRTAIKRAIWHFRDIYNKQVLELFSKYFFDTKFDVIHTNNITGFSVSVWSWAKSKNIPIVHTTRDYSLLHPNGTLFKKGKNIEPMSAGGYFYSFLKRHFSKNVSVLVGISEYIRKLHVNNGFFPNAQSLTIYNSISQRDFKEKSRNAEIVFGYLGRIEAEKGIECLLESLKGIVNYKLKIAGNGKEDYLFFLKNKYVVNNISYLGNVDITDYFPKIDYLIVPSLWHEPMGRVVIEASSFGIPVIASNRGGIPEVIKKNQTGYIFDPDTKMELSTIINRIIEVSDEEYSIISRKSWEHSRQFNSDNIVNKYLEAYQLAIFK